MLLFGISLWYVIYILQTEGVTYLQSGMEIHGLWLIVALVLLPLNVLLESAKWQSITSSFNPLSPMQILKSIVIGSYFSLLTPNRVGDGVGKLFFIKKENRKKALTGFAIASLSQLFITILFGVFGCLWLISEHTETIAGSWMFLLFAFIAIGLIGVLIFNHSKILKWLSRFKVLKLDPEHSRFQTEVLLELIGLSALRYLVFTSQFVSCLYVFKVDLPIDLMVACITVVYLITSTIPTMILAELGLREATAALVFGLFIPVGPVMAATFMLWVINLCVPAIYGGLVLTFLPKKKMVV